MLHLESCVSFPCCQVSLGQVNSSEQLFLQLQSSWCEQCSLTHTKHWGDVLSAGLRTAGLQVEAVCWGNTSPCTQRHIQGHLLLVWWMCRYQKMNSTDLTKYCPLILQTAPLVLNFPSVKVSLTYRRLLIFKNLTLEKQHSRLYDQGVSLQPVLVPLRLPDLTLPVGGWIRTLPEEQREAWSLLGLHVLSWNLWAGSY